MAYIEGYDTNQAQMLPPSAQGHLNDMVQAAKETLDMSEKDFLDTVDARTSDNMDKYFKRQMIVEHPFGTVKRAM